MKAIAVSCLILLLTSCSERIVPTVIHSSSDKAVIDLSEWSFSEKGPVRLLDNTWELYWKRLYTPKDFRDHRIEHSPVLVTGGKAWNGVIVGGEELSEDGYATYRLEIVLPEEGMYSLYMQNQDSAYRLWLNGEEAGGNGSVGTSKGDYIPQRLPRLVHHHVHGNRLEIVMQIANFTHKWGGLTNNIYLGHPEQIRGYVNRLYGIINFLAGAILIMAFYHLILYIIGHNDFSALFFSLFCFFVFVWYLFNGEYLFYRLFPSFPLGFGIRLHYAFICGILPFFLLFISSAYPDTAVRKPLRVLVGAGFGMTLIPFITPVKLFSSQILIPYYSLIIIGAVMVLTILIRALLRRKPGALFSLAGFIVFISTAGYDMLAERKIITGSSMGPFVPAGLFAFILLQSIILARQFTAAYKRLDHLTDNLEKEVRERTAALQEARERVREKEKLAALGTLAGGVSHEILNPLSGISGPLAVIRKEFETLYPGGSVSVLRHMDYIEENVHRITDVVKNLDALMKDQRIVKTDVPLLPVVRRVVEEYREGLVALDIEKGVTVSGDEGVLRQIIENLVSNAVHALEPGGNVVVRYEAGPPHRAIIVEDSGRGMEPEEVTRAFEPFYTTKETSGGSGLGLFLVRKLAESLGWEISLSSVPGERTIATITLA